MAAEMTERAIKHNPTIAGNYERLSAFYALLGRDKDARISYKECLKTWEYGRFFPDLVTVMTSFLVNDREAAERYADGLIKAGWPGQTPGYYKIYEEKKLNGEQIKNLVSGRELTIKEYGRTYWVNHSEDGRIEDLSRITEGIWWVEDDTLCYKVKSEPGEEGLPRLKDLNDCGEIYRNPDSAKHQENNFLYVKDYSIANITFEE